MVNRGTPLFRRPRYTEEKWLHGGLRYNGVAFVYESEHYLMQQHWQVEIHCVQLIPSDRHNKDKNGTRYTAKRKF